MGSRRAFTPTRVEPVRPGRPACAVSLTDKVVAGDAARGGAIPLPDLRGSRQLVLLSRYPAAELISLFRHFAFAWRRRATRREQQGDQGGKDRTHTDQSASDRALGVLVGGLNRRQVDGSANVAEPAIWGRSSSDGLDH